MANEEHLAILRQGVEVWNEWRKENPNTIPSLSEANLWRAHLRGVNLGEADLRRINLREADLTLVRLSAADIKGANLSGADLSGANLSMASLKEANLRGTKFVGTIFTEVILSKVDFSEAILGGTIFADVDLSEVNGLEKVLHQGPSSISIDTLYKSRGIIPGSFLRGAGVPEELIDYLPSLITGKAIQFYSCFISYSTKDQEFAERLHADLQSKGVRCWFAPEEMKGGRKIHEQIGEAIRTYDKLLLVLSENSMRSEWVKTEIYHARQSEINEGRRKLFPISLVEFGKVREWEAFDADTGKDMGREVREYFIPDFSRWKEHDAYQEAFERLLRDLNLEDNSGL